MTERLKRQMDFLIEIDKMKSIYRQTILIDETRRETDAEHSWHLAMMAMVLGEYAHSPEVRIDRAVCMVLVHDLVEIYAGDTYAYDDTGNADKGVREKQAADRLFGLLPEEQGLFFRRHWEEFDRMESVDAVYANALDCIQPLMNNYMTKGRMWQKNGATSTKVYQRMEKIKKGAPEVYEWVRGLIEESIKQGYLQK